MKAARAMSKTRKVVTQLRDVHLPFLWCCLYYALQPLFHYWIQHCYPTECRTHALALDVDLFDAAAICIPGLSRADDVTVQRLRLPPRMYGGGIRSLEHLAPAAFAATACRALSQMLDRRNARGELCTGFLPALTPLLGS
eukprot:106154-Karenia_brevis.AAC.1